MDVMEEMLELQEMDEMGAMRAKGADKKKPPGLPAVWSVGLGVFCALKALQPPDGARSESA
jgi:hypothetical protein